MRFSESNQGCIHFTLAGIPTTIRPSAWLVLLLLGSMSQSAASIDVASILLFIVAGMLCLLVHEYGHALTCRLLGGGGSTIEIAAMGGLTRSAYPPPTRLGQLGMVLAGPGASLLLGLLGGVLLGLQIGNIGSGVLFSIIWPLMGLLPSGAIPLQGVAPVLQAVDAGELHPFVLGGYSVLFIVSVWWTLFNLLPIIPLDGSKALHLITRNPRLVCRVGMVASVLLLVVCLTRAMVFNAFICASLAYTNWQYLRMSR